MTTNEVEERGFMLGEVRFCNFSCFLGTHVIAFPDGLTIIYGQGGTGKTSILDGMKWCLEGMGGVPGKRKSHIAFSGRVVNHGNNCWYEMTSKYGYQSYRVGRELWCDPESGFKQSLNLRLEDEVLGGVDAQRCIDELMLPRLLDFIIVDGRDLARGMRSPKQRKKAVEVAIEKPDLVRGRDLAQGVRTYFSGKHEKALSSYEVAKNSHKVATELSTLVQGIKTRIDWLVGVDDLAPEEAKRGLQVLQTEIDREHQRQEKQCTEAEKELREKGSEVDLLGKCVDLAERTRGAFEEAIRLHQEGKLAEINKNINQIFSAICSKPTFGKLKLTPNHEIIVEEMGEVYTPDRTRPSSGEQDAIAISFILGLARVASDVGCLVLDDPTVHFDEAYKRRFMSWLPKLGFRQMIVLTNDPDFVEMPEATQVLEIEMKDGRSSLKKVR